MSFELSEKITFSKVKKKKIFKYKFANNAEYELCV